MNRFKIEDIVSQDEKGVIFRAMDSESCRMVAIRRFFPFGQNGGGLDEDEAIGYAIASKKLSAIEHPSLRSVIFGAKDPIDHIPFLVTEWIKGTSLKTLLSSGTVEPLVVIEILRITLETSLFISPTLGEEAVWVDTDMESIILGTPESGRGFTFSISPNKWLGDRSEESRKLSSVVTLGEDLMGWKRKLVSDQAGYGLGGWLKWLRNNPDSSLEQALDTLATSTASANPSETRTQVSQARTPLPLKLKDSSSKTPILVAAALALIVSGLAFFHFHKTAVADPVTTVHTDPEISKELVATIPKKHQSSPDKATPASRKKTSEPVRKTKVSEANRINALAKKFAEEAKLTNAVQRQQELENEKLLATEMTSYEKRGGILTPDQFQLVRTFRNGTNVRMQGIPKSIRSSSSGKSIYLNFSEPYTNTLTNALAHIVDFEGEYEKKAFEKFIGKEVIVNGKIFVENTRDAYYVKIISIDQVSLAK